MVTLLSSSSTLSYYFFASTVWPSVVDEDPSVTYDSVGFLRRR
jgi:hypothetical protein